MNAMDTVPVVNHDLPTDFFSHVFAWDAFFNYLFWLWMGLFLVMFCWNLAHKRDLSWATACQSSLSVAATVLYTVLLSAAMVPWLLIKWVAIFISGMLGITADATLLHHPLMCQCRYCKARRHEPGSVPFTN